MFVDPTAATGGVRTDAIGSGQRFASAAMEVCPRVLPRGSEFTARWVPVYHAIASNERADEYSRAAAEGSALHDAALADSGGILHDHILSLTEMVGPSRAPLSPKP